LRTDNADSYRSAATAPAIRRAPRHAGNHPNPSYPPAPRLIRWLRAVTALADSQAAITRITPTPSALSIRR